MSKIKHFPHYLNARNDRKIKKGRLQLGIEFYAIYFMILEALAEQKDFRYPLADIDILADDFGTSIQKIQLVITQYDLFEIDPVEQFFSPAQVKALQPYLQKLEHYKLMGKKSALARKLKAEQQIEELKKLSQDDSSQPTLNDGSTYAEQLTNITNKLTNKLNIHTDYTATENQALIEKWLDEYCSRADNPQSYRATMRKKINSDDQYALAAFSSWKQEYLQNKRQEEEKRQIEEYDYMQLVGMRLGDRIINRVVDTGSMLHLFFDDGTDALNYKQDLYQWIHQKHKEAINQ